MGDGCYVTLYLYGDIKETDLPEIARGVMDEGLNPDWSIEFDNEADVIGYIKTIAIAGSACVSFVAEEVNYGNIPGVTDILSRLKVSYIVKNEAGDEYEAGRDACRFGADGNFRRVSMTCGNDGDPMVSFYDLNKAYTEGTIEQLLDEMRFVNGATMSDLRIIPFDVSAVLLGITETAP